AQRDLHRGWRGLGGPPAVAHPETDLTRLRRNAEEENERLRSTPSIRQFALTFAGVKADHVQVVILADGEPDGAARRGVLAREPVQAELEVLTADALRIFVDPRVVLFHL